MSEFRFAPKRTPQEAAARIDLSSPTAKGIAGMGMSIVADVKQMMEAGQEVSPDLMEAARYYREMSRLLSERLEAAKAGQQGATPAANGAR